MAENTSQDRGIWKEGQGELLPPFDDVLRVARREIVQDLPDGIDINDNDLKHWVEAHMGSYARPGYATPPFTVEQIAEKVKHSYLDEVYDKYEKQA
jgi:hypothetical protein